MFNLLVVQFFIAATASKEVNPNATASSSSASGGFFELFVNKKSAARLCYCAGFAEESISFIYQRCAIAALA